MPTAMHRLECPFMQKSVQIGASGADVLVLFLGLAVSVNRDPRETGHSEEKTANSPVRLENAGSGCRGFLAFLCCLCFVAAKAYFCHGFLPKMHVMRPKITKNLYYSA
jgi:hypothetical protein